MQDIGVTPKGRNARDLCSSKPVPLTLPLLDADQKALLLRWARSDAQTRKRGALLKEAQTSDISIERAEDLCQKMLNNGWISRREQLAGGNWLWESITWRDLPHLQSLMGLSSASQRLQARQEKVGEIVDWLQVRCTTTVVPALDPDLLDELSRAVTELEQDKSLRLEVLDSRFSLLKSIATWHDSRQEGSRRNFALHARDATKALTAAEWHWLESIFDLERLGIARFAQVAWLAGDIELLWGKHKVDLAPLHCLGLPLADLRNLEAVSPPERWWLIENRASFEKQASQRQQGIAVVWMPGRPSHDWMLTMSNLLRLAPAPCWISADADPAGIDIACGVGRLWEEQGSSWEPHLMGVPQWEATIQRWPLNDHDRRLLGVLLAKADLQPTLRALCEAMAQEGRKAEQEAWL
ncbi:hypothetical protein ACFQPC_00140 [Herminiimonas glaciei]|uniref:DUF2399 domain-containing protein n=1 Tax=Herminiimonas glaciei TaxID=523788 RepID=A0ABW2I600_9BURK|nr:hypothetical protein [Herminiimonas sp. KBW02]